MNPPNTITRKFTDGNGELSKTIANSISLNQGQIMTEKEKTEAINARINGEWDNPQLQKIGALGCIDKDIARIIKYEE